MQEKTSHRIVTGLAISVWILTGVTVILTLVELAQWRFFTAEGLQLLRDTPLFTAFINTLFVAAFGIAIGYGLLRRRRWARILGLVFATLVIIDAIIYLFYHTLSISVLLTIVLSCFIIWVLAFSEARKLFSK